MFRPENPLKPRDEVFKEAWHAQTLALADTMVRAGHFNAEEWAKTLGAALSKANQNGEPDTAETYYHCAINALEQLVAAHVAIDQQALSERKIAWTRAYHATPHGQPIVLGADKP